VSTGAAQTAGSAAGHAQTTPTTSTASTQTEPSSTTTATSGASGQGAVAAAEQICARRNHALAAIPDTATNLRALAAAARRRAGVDERAVSELEKVSPPADLAARYRQLIAFDKAALLRVVTLGERAEAGDAAAVRLAKAKAASGRLRLLILLAHTGLKECSAIG
jgi:hypothetical protein